MIVCKTCGRANEDDADFCSECGRYLAWVGEYVPPEPEEVVEPEPEEAVVPPRLGFFRRAALRLGIGRHPSDPADAPAASAPLAPPEVLEAPPDTVAVPVVAGAGGAMSDDVPDLVGLVGGTQAIGALASDSGPTDTAGALALSPGEVVTSPGVSSRPTPALRRPTEIDLARQARQRRRTNVVTLPGGPDAPKPGDVFCPRCEQFNAPTRYFCRRCGTELGAFADEGEVREYQPLSFWRRHFRRDHRIALAGARPGRWGKASSGGAAATRMRIMARVGAVVIGIFVVFSYLGPVAQPLRNWYSNVYHSFIKKVDVTYTQQFAVGANASTSYPDHAAGLAVDDADNTYWQSMPSKKENGAGQYLTIVFAAPTTIDRLGVLSGAGPSEQAYLGEARPKQILITIGKKGGQQFTETLQDTSKFQHLDLHAANVTSLTVKVVSVYPSATGHAVAITEIEFFQRT